MAQQNDYSTRHIQNSITETPNSIIADFHCAKLIHRWISRSITQFSQNTHSQLKIKIKAKFNQNSLRNTFNNIAFPNLKSERLLPCILGAIPPNSRKSKVKYINHGSSLIDKHEKEKKVPPEF